MSLPATEAFAGSGNLSSNWTQAIGASPQQVSGNCQPGATSDNEMWFWNADIFDNDQYAQIKFVAAGAGGGGVGVAVRCAANKGYFAQATATTVVVYRYDSGFTLLDTIVNVFAANDILKIEAIGTAIKVYKNGSQIGTTYTDSVLTSGAAGLFISATVAVADSKLDDWEGGNTTVAGIVPIFPMSRSMFSKNKMLGY